MTLVQPRPTCGPAHPTPLGWHVGSSLFLCCPHSSVRVTEVSGRGTQHPRAIRRRYLAELVMPGHLYVA